MFTRINNVYERNYKILTDQIRIEPSDCYLSSLEIFKIKGIWFLVHFNCESLNSEHFLEAYELTVNINGLIGKILGNKYFYHIFDVIYYLLHSVIWNV